MAMQLISEELLKLAYVSPRRSPLISFGMI